MTVTEKSEEYLLGNYRRFPIEISEGCGSILFDSCGKEYIDFASGVGVNALGACDSGWIAAVTAQLSRIQHTSNSFYSLPAAELAETLCRRTGMRKVFFSNSGAEANEAAIKAARKYGKLKKGDGYFNIVTVKMSFHGRTLATVAASGQAVLQAGFEPITPGFIYCDDDPGALKRLVSENRVAAIMLETVRGEGGVVPLSEKFIRAAEEISRREDILLIVDEVQTGNGRCGYLYSYMKYGIAPDIVTTAKGLGGGLPIGATMFGERTENIIGKGEHGSTFGGNPVACAGALYVLSRIDDALLAGVRARSEYAFSALKSARGIKSVTGAGLMIGIEPEKPAEEVLAICRERGLLAVKAKEKLRLLPPLSIPWSLFEKGIGIIIESCK